MSEKPLGMAALDAMGEEEIFARVAAGDYAGEIAKAAGCSRKTFFRWIKAGGAERKAAYELAQLEGADGHIERGAEELEVDPKDTATVSLAKARADFRFKLAERLNRAKYGDAGNSLNVNLSVGELHLEALKAKGSMALHGPLVLPGKVEEVEDG